MKKIEALDAMEYVDTDLINEAATYRQKSGRKRWLKYLSVAACLSICFISITLFYPILGNKPQDLSILEENNSIDETNNSSVKESDENGAMIDPQNEGIKVEAETMISGYDPDLNVYTDISVYNGAYAFSNSLQAAIDKYGDTVSYRVIVEMFKDGVAIGNGNQEVTLEENRLSSEGYIVAHEQFKDENNIIDYFTIHAKKEQLLNFSVNDQYGYFISFYDEFIENQSVGTKMDNTISVNEPELAVDESKPGFIQGTEYPNEILDIQEHISQGMSSGKLPFVYESAIYEEPLRIELSVGNVDESQIEELYAEYDPERKYVVIKQGTQAIRE